MKSVIAAGGAGMIVVKDAKETFYMLGQREGRFPSQRHFPPAVLAGPGTLASALGVAVAGAPEGTGPFAAHKQKTKNRQMFPSSIVLL